MKSLIKVLIVLSNFFTRSLNFQNFQTPKVFQVVNNNRIINILIFKVRDNRESWKSIRIDSEKSESIDPRHDMITIQLPLTWGVVCTPSIKV